VNTHFDRVTRDVHAHARKVVAMAATEGAQAAVTKGSERGMGPATVEAVRPTADGWIASFVMAGAHQWFQNYGTLGNRRKPLKQPPRTNRTRAPGTGIEPLGHLDEGRRAGVRALRRELARGL
jgi:hypothetical protein